MIKLKVKITKEILKKSMYCGNGEANYTQNCAIALAVKSIFPEANVYRLGWHPLGWRNGNKRCGHNGKELIDLFDISKTEERLLIPETEVELEITEEILNELNKNVNWKEIVNNTKHLELV